MFLLSIQHSPMSSQRQIASTLNAMWGPGLPASTIDQQKIIDQLSPAEHDIVLNEMAL